jgi:GH25 family lysozyme M1 (1,4-beta-N-acetylmuramidase)
MPLRLTSAVPAPRTYTKPSHLGATVATPVYTRPLLTRDVAWVTCDAGNTKDFAKHPLWYAHYDSTANMKDFKPFGGWTAAAVKQYDGNKPLCGCNVDLNVAAPGSPP